MRRWRQRGRRSVDRGTRRPGIQLRNQLIRGAQPVDSGEGNTGRGATREPRSDPAQSETLSMRGNSFHGNREVPRVPDGDGRSGRPEKASRTSGTNARGKSDGRIVPGKPPNKDGESRSAEAAEGRRPTEGNASQTAARRTQGRGRATNGLRRVRGAAERPFLRQLPEVGAVCGKSARTDLRGGRRATGVPPATRKPEFDFRWNTMDITDGERMVAGLRKVVGKRLMYRPSRRIN